MRTRHCQGAFRTVRGMATLTRPTRPVLVGLTVLATLPWALSLGCIIYRPIVTRPATLGDELLSLDSARKSGLLTDEEYAARRAQTIAEWRKIADTPIEVPQ